MLLSPPRRTSCNNNIAPFFIESVALHAHGSQTDNQLHANPISKTGKSKSKWRLQLAPALETPNPASSRPSPLPPPPPKPRPTPPSRATPKSPSRKLPRAQVSSRPRSRAPRRRRWWIRLWERVRRLLGMLQESRGRRLLERGRLGARIA
ncbi:hypothetical protein SNOG_09722 [Parastagonospora nodorum SN15]|uniref:Uncharacterized protein n=1 Tax=Phaeosphaeria nodorum (strain SN15 / ATCC MYA-4574 / FGSC 10173) TaxID=321614 RepID=Q0UEU2_PHANO|nr:hypothetical protein SNOG_09722 [Parastagonospora nodorum SN15]EAT82987.2 hypothetical protein SNOG_09722 [Parastagonospora nodorum SN15]